MQGDARLALGKPRGVRLKRHAGLAQDHDAGLVLTEEERALLNGDRVDPSLLVPKVIREKSGMWGSGNKDGGAGSGYSEIPDPAVDPEK
jgi:hypothetical protein